jgi:pSer/pThr/pTyr-binding forkhead associated (FHA) protein
VIDPLVIALWAVRILFLVLVYLFLAAVVRILVHDLRAAARDAAAALGRLVVLASPGAPPIGAVFLLDAVTTIGRNVSNAVVCEDPFVSARHAVLTYRGGSWYVEDQGSTNGTFVNGARTTERAAVRFGDELTIGEVRFVLERPQAAA